MRILQVENDSSLTAMLFFLLEVYNLTLTTEQVLGQVANGWPEMFCKRAG